MQPPVNFKKMKPIIGLTRARKQLRRFNTKIGQEHKDRCPTCYKHELHIALGKELNATAETKRLADEHKAAYDIHRDIANRAILQQDAEREACKAFNTQQVRPSENCNCNDHAIRGWCGCAWLTREGFVHIQADKGSKLGLPITFIGPMWYKSRSNIFVEHFTDNSREVDDGRRTAHFWEESVAAGGKVNMISVLFHYLCHHPSGREGATIWFDNCYKEFKNWTFIFFLVWLVMIKKMFLWIEIKYYESGHSFMGGFGPDSTHSLIIAEAKSNVQTFVPEDWMAAARRAAKGHIKVVDFKAEFHRNWHTFLGQFFAVDTGVGEGRTKVDIEGKAFDLRKTRALRIGADNMGLVQAWKLIDGTVAPQTVCVVKKAFPPKVVSDLYHRCFSLGANPLGYNQVKGIMAAWQYMTPDGVHRAYWEGRLTNQACIVQDEAGKAREKGTHDTLLARVLAKGGQDIDSGLDSSSESEREGERERERERERTFGIRISSRRCLRRLNSD
jgi:hypothetical protein